MKTVLNVFGLINFGAALFAFYFYGFSAGLNGLAASVAFLSGARVIELLEEIAANTGKRERAKE